MKYRIWDRMKGRHFLHLALRNSHARPMLLFLQKKFRLKPRALCLIVACPRSGSTALAAWLARHYDVVSAEQSRILPTISRFIQDADSFKSLSGSYKLLLQLSRKLVWRYYSNSSFLWSRVLIDKENFDLTAFSDGQFEKFLDTVQKLFPQIKILFLVRDPVATIWSMQKKEWWGYSLTHRPLFRLTMEECIEIWNDSAMLASKYRGDKNAYVCEFEKLVADPEKESEQISRFLGISFNQSFSPNSTASIGFDQTEQRYILNATKAPRLELDMARKN